MNNNEEVENFQLLGLAQKRRTEYFGKIKSVCPECGNIAILRIYVIDGHFGCGCPYCLDVPFSGVTDFCFDVKKLQELSKYTFNAAGITDWSGNILIRVRYFTDFDGIMLIIHHEQIHSCLIHIKEHFAVSMFENIDRILNALVFGVM